MGSKWNFMPTMVKLSDQSSLYQFEWFDYISFPLYKFWTNYTPPWTSSVS
ncbi:hypothetical protein THRCLA_11830 [Thraustotheca clavata]|uniref:Uncharacterized protein n=1 Tax=Thraustotheca clavata TaxID=74557 RepID=A0A1V9Y6I1_9STRA|nr:hypothetical protein THRCLA_11830 [Thraustotheca clavata]